MPPVKSFTFRFIYSFFWWSHADHQSLWLTTMCGQHSVECECCLHMILAISSCSTNQRKYEPHRYAKMLAFYWSEHILPTYPPSSVGRKDLSFLKPFLNLVLFQPIYSFCAIKFWAWWEINKPLGQICIASRFIPS